MQLDLLQQLMFADNLTKNMSSKYIGLQSLTIRTCMLITALDYDIHLRSWQQGSLDNVWALRKCHGGSKGHVQSRCLLTLGRCFTSLHIFSLRSENLNGELGQGLELGQWEPLLHLYLVSFYFSKHTVALHFFFVAPIIWASLLQLLVVPLYQCTINWHVVWTTL